MSGFSRRKFIYFSAFLSLVYPGIALAAQSKKDNYVTAYPKTLYVIKRAFRVEMIAHRNYVGFTGKALQEGYPNIAYLFQAFSVSEKIHAENYKRILAAFGQKAESAEIGINVHDTKSNLRQAARNELDKINITYPEFLNNLEAERCEEAIVNVMYSWKSHQQHEEKVNEILKYSSMFFGSGASEIEGTKLDFHVCDVCGSTIDEPPRSPCIICNRSIANYRKVVRPT
jgi:rubrerythrin